MKFRSYNIELHPVIKSVKHFPIYNFLDEEFDFAIPEFKEIEFKLSIKIRQSEWEIPFLVVLSKHLKKELVNNYNTKMNADSNNFFFMKVRKMNIPLSLLIDQKEIDVLIDFMLVIHSGYKNSIEIADYENLTPDLFLNNEDLENICNDEKNQYCIRQYYKYQVPKNILGYTNSPEMWKMPQINLISRKTDTEKIEYPYQDRTANIYNIVPVSYSSAFCDSFKTLKSYSRFEEYRPHFYRSEKVKDLFSWIFNPMQKEIVSNDLFVGDYYTCKDVLTNTEMLKKIESEFHKAQKNEETSSGGNDDWPDDREYESAAFYFMTEGQLGNYEDFEGNMDDIETWSRG